MGYQTITTELIGDARRKILTCSVGRGTGDVLKFKMSKKDTQYLSKLTRMRHLHFYVFFCESRETSSLPLIFNLLIMTRAEHKRGKDLDRVSEIEKYLGDELLDEFKANNDTRERLESFFQSLQSSSEDAIQKWIDDYYDPDMDDDKLLGEAPGLEAKAIEPLSRVKDLLFAYLVMSNSRRLLESGPVPTIVVEQLPSPPNPVQEQPDPFRKRIEDLTERRDGLKKDIDEATISKEDCVERTIKYKQDLKRFRDDIKKRQKLDPGEEIRECASSTKRLMEEANGFDCSMLDVVRRLKKESGEWRNDIENIEEVHDDREYLKNWLEGYNKFVKSLEKESGHSKLSTAHKTNLKVELKTLKEEMEAFEKRFPPLLPKPMKGTKKESQGGRNPNRHFVSPLDAGKNFPRR
jgi:hypothetical protein